MKIPAFFLRLRLRSLLPWLLAALLSPALVANADEEPLHPDQAFQFSAQMQDDETLLVQWAIADGYYLYRHKLSFNSNTPGIKLGDPEIPDGKKKTDEFFGEVETYRHLLAVKIPIKRTDNAIKSFQLTAGSQGCADMGICYPPQKHVAMLDLPALSAKSTAQSTPQSTASTGNPLDILSKINNSIGLQEEEFLPPDAAFPLDAYIEDSLEDGTNIVARWNIADGYYLYRNKFSFAIVDGPAGIKLGQAELPQGTVKQDEFFGRIEAYYGDTTVRIPVLAEPGTTTAGQKLAVKFDYQGCAEAGICYPPISRTIDFQLPDKPLSAGKADLAETKVTEKPESVDEEPSASTETSNEISGKKKLLALLAAFGIGILLTFTPCVLPMIPILSSIIIGQGSEHITKLRGGMLALFYVLGTSVTYTAAGILAGLTGDQLQAYFQNAWAIGILSGILVLMSLSMFGLFELQMPSFIQSRLQGGNQRGGKFAGVFIMGIISSLIVGACVSPLLITALGLAIATKDPVLGGGIMFSMSMGMGVILIAIGIGASSILPKAGGWMENVKYVFGVLLLAVAIYLLGILPGVPILYLWAALFIVTAIYLSATQGIPADSSGWRYLWKGVGTVLLIWGVLALLGGMSGNRDILNPMPLGMIGSNKLAVTNISGANVSREQTPDHTALFEAVNTLEQINIRLEEARVQNKPVIIDFFATWCTDCLRMEKSTFIDARIVTLLRNEFISLQVDVTDPNDPDGRAIKKHFSVFGPPAMLFFSAEGKPLKELNFYGYKAPDEFYEHAKQAL